ncbi:MAG: adenylate/guanylate cyclase domain-containing protein [Alphaproteobacteria bacterium]|nr:MAG: adenylate/guanylate cyclase domain-containing protein [Alphaproteobacteria bacterium]
MSEERVQRRLAAILAVDVVGYSHLMAEDEVGTLATLWSLRKDVLNPLIAKFAGRLVKVMDDGVLIEFSSTVNAGQCCRTAEEDRCDASSRAWPNSGGSTKPAGRLSFSWPAIALHHQRVDRDAADPQ